MTGQFLRDFDRSITGYDSGNVGVPDRVEVEDLSFAVLVKQEIAVFSPPPFFRSSGVSDPEVPGSSQVCPSSRERPSWRSSTRQSVAKAFPPEIESATPPLTRRVPGDKACSRRGFLRMICPER